MSSLNREASERFNAIKKSNPGMTTNQALVASGAGSMVDLNNQLYNTGVSSRNVPAYSPERQIPPPPPPPNYDRRLPPSVMEQMLLTGGFVNQYDQDTGNYLYGPADNIQYFDNPAEYSAAVSGRNQPEPEQDRERYESDMGTEVPERRSPPMETPGSRDRDVPPVPRDNDPKGSVYNRSLFKSAQTRPARNKLEKMAGIRGLNPEPPGPRIRQEFNPNIDPATGQPYGPGDPNGPGYKNSLPPAPINPNINPAINPATGQPWGLGDPNSPFYQGALPPAPINPNINPATGQPYGMGDPANPNYQNTLGPSRTDGLNPATGQPYMPGDPNSPFYQGALPPLTPPVEGIGSLNPRRPPVGPPPMRPPPSYGMPVGGGKSYPPGANDLMPYMGPPMDPRVPPVESYYNPIITPSYVGDKSSYRDPSMYSGLSSYDMLENSYDPDPQSFALGGAIAVGRSLIPAAGRELAKRAPSALPAVKSAAKNAVDVLKQPGVAKRGIKMAVGASGIPMLFQELYDLFGEDKVHDTMDELEEAAKESPEKLTDLSVEKSGMENKREFARYILGEDINNLDEINQRIYDVAVASSIGEAPDRYAKAVLGGLKEMKDTAEKRGVAAAGGSGVRDRMSREDMIINLIAQMQQPDIEGDLPDMDETRKRATEMVDKIIAGDSGEDSGPKPTHKFNPETNKVELV